MKNKILKGFTLIELLIVIGIISILAGIVLVAVNPAQQFGKANDSERKSEIGTILSAIYQYTTSPTARGNLPTCLDVTASAQAPLPDCDDTGLAGSAFDGAIKLGTDAGHMDCSSSLIPAYLREMPIDPTSTYDAGDTGYWACADRTGAVARVYVLATGAEVYNNDGGCFYPGDPDDYGTEPLVKGAAPTATTETMCVSG